MVFGDGSDLQIYHSGVHSYIDDAGTGNLTLRGNASVRVEKYEGEILADFAADGAVSLYHDNSVKIATTSTGVNVTGTVEFDGLSGTGAVNVTDILDQDDMSSNSATALATQQSIKAYVDSQVATVDTLAEVLGNGNTTGGTDIAVGTGDDITFADSSKAIFGAGSDLKIYHNGFSSIIQDSGDGDLYIGSDANLLITDAALSDVKAKFVSNGAVELRYDNAAKLATTSTGIDVTGTVTADGLTVEGTINAYRAGFTQGVQLLGDSGGNQIIGTATNDKSLIIKNNAATKGIEVLTANKALDIANNGDISFYEDTGTTAKFFWDASTERLGLNTSTPEAGIQVAVGSSTIPSAGSSGSSAVFGNATSGSAYGLALGANSSGVGYISAQRTDGTATTYDLSIQPNGGNVGIGTSSPSVPLHVINASPELRLQDSDDNGYLAFNHNGANSYVSTTQGGILFRTGGTNERMRIDSSGRIGIGTTNPLGNMQIVTATAGTVLNVNHNTGGTYPKASGIGLGATSTALSVSSDGSTVSFTGGAGLYAENTAASGNPTNLVFWTNATGSPAERMRIDSGGNLGIGTASPDAKIHGAGSQGSGDVPFIFENSATTGVATSSIVFAGNGGSGAEKARIKSAVYGDGYMAFHTNDDTERMRIDASGNLLVGKTNNTLSNDGTVIRTGGEILVTNTNDIVANFNRTGTNGSIVTLYKDGSTVGSIGVNGSHVYIGTNDTTLKMDSANNGIFPRGTDGAQRDAAIQLGSAGNRFTDLYLSGGAYLGGTGSANKLDDYEEGTFTPTFGGSTTNPTVTYAVQSGVYTKIGNLVTATVVVGTSANTGGAGSIQIKGLPFAAKNASEYRARDMINTFNLDVDTNCIGVGVEGVQNGDYLLLLESRDNAIWRQVTWSQATAASIYFAFTFQYYV